MAYTIKNEHDRIIGFSNDLKSAYQQARTYLLSQDHKHSELMIELEKVENRRGVFEWEIKEVEEKLNRISNNAVVYDCFNRPVAKYICGYGQVEKIEIKEEY